MGTVCVCCSCLYVHIKLTAASSPLYISIEVVDIHISDRGRLNAEDVAQLLGPLAGLMVA